MKLSFVSYDENDWEKNGDFYYYKKILPPDANTSDIEAKLTLTDEQKKILGDTFDIVVVHESAVAVFDENNKVRKPSGWDYIPDISAE